MEEDFGFCILQGYLAVAVDKYLGAGDSVDALHLGRDAHAGAHAETEAPEGEAFREA